MAYTVATGIEASTTAYTAIATTGQLGTLALPMGAAALSAGYQPRPAAMAALALGVLSALAFVSLMILALLAG